jgi:biopolymer transport protein ExbD
MGVSTGRGTPSLNLVPFLDLLSVCITFLMATAVWIELESMPVEQAGGGESASEPGWRLVVFEDHFEVGRTAMLHTTSLRAAVSSLDADPGSSIVISAADGVEWQRVVGVLDEVSGAGFGPTFDPNSPGHATRPR